jgi:hypothetical protein
MLQVGDVLAYFAQHGLDAPTKLFYCCSPAAATSSSNGHSFASSSSSSRSPGRLHHGNPQAARTAPSSLGTSKGHTIGSSGWSKGAPVKRNPYGQVISSEVDSGGADDAAAGDRDQPGKPLLGTPHTETCTLITAADISHDVGACSLMVTIHYHSLPCPALCHTFDPTHTPHTPVHTHPGDLEGLEDPWALAVVPKEGLGYPYTTLSATGMVQVGLGRWGWATSTAAGCTTRPRCRDTDYTPS